MRYLFFVNTLILSAFVILGGSCNKSGNSSGGKSGSSMDTAADFISYQINGINSQVTMSPPFITVTVRDSITSGSQWTATFTLSAGAQAVVNGVNQVSGSTQNNFESVVNYYINSPSGATRIWPVQATNNAYTLPRGLGQWLRDSRSNDRSYNWYIDQQYTGPCWSYNCGPSSVTMALMYADSTFTRTAADARSQSGSTCGDWAWWEITDYIKASGYSYQLVAIGDSARQMRDNFKNQLDSGRVIIVGADMTPILLTTAGTGSHVDRFYAQFSGNHYFVIKGYRKTETDFFFEVYDPWDLGLSYADGTPQGKNRYYRYEQVYIGCNNFAPQGTEVVMSRVN